MRETVTRAIKTIRWIAAVVVLLMLCVFQEPAAAQAGTIIFVTSLEDKISSTGGCSLQEAIYSANLNNNTAPDSFNDDGSEHLIPTQCVPGSPDGIDILVLPAAAVFSIDHPILDAHNPFGFTATPMVTSRIRIEANGSTLRDTGTKNFRAFAVGSTGELTISQAYIVGFAARGGDGKLGGGGGMGAGGAIYVKGSGSLTIEDSTFDGNGAIGGNGSHYEAGFAGGGGGGGMGGAGFGDGSLGSGGGGGGSGGDAEFQFGGGTIPRPSSFSRELYAAAFCGGVAHGFGAVGGAGLCPGGGGAGGTHPEFTYDCLPIIGSGAGKGGEGNYGGGGGGGGSCEDGSGAAGGDGGFGGGGGAGASANGDDCDSGGSSEFGGGGGACVEQPGTGGQFGGNAVGANGGGGGALGGAIFSDAGNVVIRNSTFTSNSAVRGIGGENGTPGAADNGADAGGAIYSSHGSLEIRNSTITGNQSTGSLAGVAVSGASLSLFNTIISNNGAQECGIGTGSTGNGAGNLTCPSQ
jgi:hypothetical protein